MSALSPNPASSAASNGAEPFLFLYFSQLAGAPVLHTVSGEALGTVADFTVQATTPYPTVSGVRVRVPGGSDKLYPWSAVRALNERELYLDPEAQGTPVVDYAIRRDLLRRLAVEVSETKVVRIWDLHFVYSENKMVLAHAETGIRGRLRYFRLEKPVMKILGGLLKVPLRERFATFRHLQVLRRLPDGSFPIPPRILEMHPADLASVLRQLSPRLRRRVFRALSDEAAAAVVAESTASLQRHLLSACPRERREAIQRFLQGARPPKG